jgi:hypothetical protein
MSHSARLLALVALTFSRPALLAPLCRWALRALRRRSPVLVRSRARGRTIVRRRRPISAVHRAGPHGDLGIRRRTAKRAGLNPGLPFSY